jgi:hypothetical protein
MDAKIHISKLDAAKRQLELALNLFFHNGDVVSMHTLVGAAYDILKGLCDAQGADIYALKNKKFVKPEKYSDYLNIVNKPQNFFKHADTDATAILEFNPSVTEIFLFDAVNTYQGLTGEITPIMLLFRAWFYLKNSDMIDSKMLAQFQEFESKLKLDTNNRGAFLEFLPLIKSF